MKYNLKTIDIKTRVNVLQKIINSKYLVDFLVDNFC